MVDSDDSDSSEIPDYREVYENRVRFAETDQQGVVFYGEYFTYQDEAFSAFLRAIDYPHRQMLENGWETRVVNASLDYRASARFEDCVVNDLRISKIGTSSLVSAYRARRRSDDAVLVEGTVTHVAIDAETDESIRVPDDFREAVAAFQGGLPTE